MVSPHASKTTSRTIDNWEFQQHCLEILMWQIVALTRCLLLLDIVFGVHSRFWEDVYESTMFESAL